MRIPLLDLKRQYQTIQDEVRAAADEVFASQQFILGPKVEELERNIAEYCQCASGVAVSSGTDALLISLMCAGVGPGDIVITTPYTFFATAGSVARLGATLLFVDIERETYNLSPLRLEEGISKLKGHERSRLKAIIPVHLYGQCADMEPIVRIARENHMVVIEDAAQAVGSEYAWKDGRVNRAGSIGDYGCFSFFPSKNLGGFGDGGMVTLSSSEICHKLRIIRAHGSEPKYYHKLVGGNFRLDALQAAILLVKLKHLDDWTNKRIANAGLYRKLFAKNGVDRLILPLEKGKRHVYNQFVVRMKEKRDALRVFLTDNGIGSEIYYPVSLHLQECFRHLGYREGDFPEAESAARETLALPIFPELTGEEIQFVVDKVSEFLAKNF